MSLASMYLSKSSPSANASISATSSSSAAASSTAAASSVMAHLGRAATLPPVFSRRDSAAASLPSWLITSESAASGASASPARPDAAAPASDAA